MSGEFDEARVKLVMRQPFFGSMILQMPEKEMTAPQMKRLTKGHATAAVVVTVDKVTHKALKQELWYCKEFVDGLTKGQRQGLLCHEVLHLGLGHPFPWRKGRRDDNRWGAATDYVVNLIVKDAGIELPPHGLCSDKFRDMTAEQVYDKMPDDPPDHCHGMPEIVFVVGEGGGDDDKKGKGKKSKDAEKDKQNRASKQHDEKSMQKPQPQPGAGDEGDEEEEDGAGDDGDDGEGEEDGEFQVMPDDAAMQEVQKQWENNLVRAVLMAKAQGKCPAGLERLVDDMIQPKIPWQTLLERYLNEVLKTDYDWMRCDRRFMGGVTVMRPDGSVDRNQAMYLPDLFNEGADVAVAVDTSGSIDDLVLLNFASEVVGMLRARNVRSIRLIACDAAITMDEILKPGDLLPKKFPGGGGTDFRPVFDLINEGQTKPKVLVYMTDLCGSFPTEADAADFVTIWLSVNRNYQPPFGQVLEYEVTDDVVAGSGRR